MQNQFQYCPNCRQVISIADSCCKHCGYTIVKPVYENKYQSNSTGDEKTTNLEINPQNISSIPSGESSSKKNILLIIGIVLAVVAFIVLMVCAVTKKGPNKKDKETTETEATTEEVVTTTEATEATTEEVPEETTEISTEAIVPEGMSDDWKDMQISIDGDIYQLPIAYEEFMSTGWTFVSGDENVPAMSTIKVVVERNGMQCRLLVKNFDVLEGIREDGYITAIYMDAEMVPIGQHQVILPGGVTLYQSSAEAIVSAYGEASLATYGDEVTQLDYSNSTFNLMAEFLVDKETNVLGSILLYYSRTPEWVSYDMSKVPTSAPDINNNYVAPSGPSQNAFDSIVSVDGVDYQLPVPLSVFLDNGWTINPAEDDLIPGKSNRDYTIYKDDTEIDVCLRNYTMDAMYPVNAMVVGIRASDYFCNVDVIFPGGLYFENDTGIDFENVYSDIYYFEDDGYDVTYEVDYIDEYIYIYASAAEREEYLDYYYYEFIPPLQVD